MYIYYKVNIMCIKLFLLKKKQKKTVYIHTHFMSKSQHTKETVMKTMYVHQAFLLGFPSI